MSIRPAIALLAVLLLAGSTLGACSDLEGSSSSGYVSLDGQIRTVAAAEREAPVSFEGEDLDGKPMSLADFQGKPAVIVVWGSWCVDCRSENDAVQAAADQLKGTAQFVGVDIRETSPDNALAYVASHDIDYPSFYSPSGEALLAFRGVLGPNSIPAFVVLDAEGRVAASINGPLPSTLTLVDLVEDVAKSSAA